MLMPPSPLMVVERCNVFVALPKNTVAVSSSEEEELLGNPSRRSTAAAVGTIDGGGGVTPPERMGFELRSRPLELPNSVTASLSAGVE